MGPAPGQKLSRSSLLVAFFMGFHTDLYHQHKELLEVNCVVLIDVQLFEQGFSILLLSRRVGEKARL